MFCRSVAAALLVLLAISPAFGADDRIVVPYGDLDLHAPAGQSALKARLVQAASTLCYRPWMAKNPDSEFDIHYRQVIYRACVGRVTNRAMDRIEAGTKLDLPDF